MGKRSLAEKLETHRFTVVQEANSNDPDVIAFKKREAQAKARAKARAEIEASKREETLDNGLVIRIDGSRRQGALANALIAAKKIS